MNEDLIKHMQETSRRLDSVERGSTLTRPNAKWVGEPVIDPPGPTDPYYVRFDDGVASDADFDTWIAPYVEFGWGDRDPTNRVGSVIDSTIEFTETAGHWDRGSGTVRSWWIDISEIFTEAAAFPEDDTGENGPLAPDMMIGWRYTGSDVPLDDVVMQTSVGGVIATPDPDTMIANQDNAVQDVSALDYRLPGWFVSDHRPDGGLGAGVDSEPGYDDLAARYGSGSTYATTPSGNQLTNGKFAAEGVNTNKRYNSDVGDWDGMSYEWFRPTWQFLDPMEETISWGGITYSPAAAKAVQGIVVRGVVDPDDASAILAQFEFFGVLVYPGTP